MNYLAHIYLSGNNNNFKIGNFIGDFVKGNPNEQFSEQIAYGIHLHRKIDRFTDTHALVRKSRNIFFTEFRHYSGVITDVLFDYFLAKNWKDYHSQNLIDFVQDFYDLLNDNFEKLPASVQRVYPIMKKHNWLYNYRTLDGIQQILFQMNKRTASNPGLGNSIVLLNDNYNELESYFTIFFDELKLYVNGLIEEYQKKSHPN